MNRQIPSGLPRDLDIALDFPGLAADLTAEIAVVQNAFQKFVSDRYFAVDREHDPRSAQCDAQPACPSHPGGAVRRGHRQSGGHDCKSGVANAQKEIDDLQKDIEAARNKGFSLGDLISTVGSVAEL